MFYIAVKERNPKKLIYVVVMTLLALLWVAIVSIMHFYNAATIAFSLESYKLLKFIYMLRWFVMTCYFRHIQQIFKKAGIEVTRDNKREIDRAIHGIVGVEYKK